MQRESSMMSQMATTMDAGCHWKHVVPKHLSILRLDPRTCTTTIVGLHSLVHTVHVLRVLTMRMARRDS